MTTILPPPTFIRKVLFEESSTIGLALTDIERNKIIDLVCIKNETNCITNKGNHVGRSRRKSNS